ncbi:MAG TPA: hypothetical protein VHG93_02705, partial [Longimicrobium sp.]|nr:hypothetical protein [Longimicrobium sp.]
MHPRHPDLAYVGQGLGIQRRMLGLALVIEFLAHPLADLLGDLAGVDGRVHAAVDGENPFELTQIRLHGGLHVRVLELAGQLLAVQRGRPVHLAEGGCGRGGELEGSEAALPLRTQLRLHAPLDEGRPHRGRLRLQLLQFGRV